MKTINELCDTVRQTAYDIRRFQIRKYVFSQGRLIETGSRRLACLIPFVSAFFAFFRG